MKTVHEFEAERHEEGQQQKQSSRYAESFSKDFHNKSAVWRSAKRSVAGLLGKPRYVTIPSHWNDWNQTNDLTSSLFIRSNPCLPSDEKLSFKAGCPHAFVPCARGFTHCFSDHARSPPMVNSSHHCLECLCLDRDSAGLDSDPLGARQDQRTGG